jgi:hypothetical protein
VAGAGELFQELRMRLSERNERGAFSWHSVHGMRIASGMGLHGIVCGVHYEDFEIGMNIMSIQNNDNGLKLENAERPWAGSVPSVVSLRLKKG